MTLSQFICPHCRSPFQVEPSSASQQVACPHCWQPVALLSEPPLAEPPSAPPPVMEPPLEEPPLADPPLAELTITEPPPRVSGDYSPTDLLPPSAAISPEPTAPRQVEQRGTITEDYLSRQVAASDRASRKFVKNMIVWVCCAIVLISIVAFFVIRGGS